MPFLVFLSSNACGAKQPRGVEFLSVGAFAPIAAPMESARMPVVAALMQVSAWFVCARRKPMQQMIEMIDRRELSRSDRRLDER